MLSHGRVHAPCRLPCLLEASASGHSGLDDALRTGNVWNARGRGCGGLGSGEAPVPVGWAGGRKEEAEDEAVVVADSVVLP